MTRCMRRIDRTIIILIAFFFVAFGHRAPAAELKQKTTAAFDRYMAATEARFANELRPGGGFLYIDGLGPDQRRAAYAQLKQGEILVEKLETKAPGVSPDV